MIFFAVKHLPTGKLMPQLGRGATWWDPNEGARKHTRQKRNIPRLFKRKVDAENAAKWWSAGEWYGSTDQDGDPTIDLSRDSPKRSRSDLLIIEVELTEVQPNLL